ncbi:hypothetical protein [Rickettsiella massiliensis]|uniref:hypothetical protein n=1 Tax=Rickettsiella massiliensis TaxID=676517 RepID=UPI00029B1F6A|nr:hypothetical protein [Rickettsiella massiliensis]
MSNITIGKLKEISRLIDEELKKIKDERLLEQLDDLKSIIEHLTANRKDEELLLNEDQQVDEQLVKNTLSGLKEIEKQFKGNKTWSALKKGAQFLFMPIQVLFKSKYSTGGWVALLALGFVAIIGCLFAGAATIAAYYPLCMLAISVGVLGLLGCALFSDRVGGFVKSWSSKVKSLFSR